MTSRHSTTALKSLSSGIPKQPSEAGETGTWQNLVTAIGNKEGDGCSGGVDRFARCLDARSDHPCKFDPDIRRSVTSTPIDLTGWLRRISVPSMAKDYSLTGDANRAAVENGLANPTWFRPKVDPADIRALMVKSDAIAMRDTVIWLGMMVATAAVGIALWARGI